MTTPTLPPFQEPTKASLLRLLWKLTGRSRSFDCFLSSFLKERMHLPVMSPDKLLPRFFESRVSLVIPPLGPWATPAGDTLTLLKAVVGFESKRILEIGSYRGTTARLMAQNTGPDTKIFALDCDPNHGEVYRNTPEEAKITRIVGDSSLENMQTHAPYDFIFVDGDHSRKGAFRDSMAAIEVLSDDGVIFWHDYHNNNYFVHRQGAVSEALKHVAELTKLPIVAIEGTMIAMHSRVSGWETKSLFG